MSEVEDLRAEVERLREQVKQLQYDLLLGPKPAEVTP
jgi:polyhydroxyalkanoate synthesis regulator phasin